MSDPFVLSRKQDKFLRLSSSKVDDFGDYETPTAEQRRSPSSSISSRASRSSVPGGTLLARQCAHRPCSRSPLPSGARSPRDTPRITRQATHESELKQKIQYLEGTVAEYERQKFNVMGTFAEYRQRVAERERTLEGEYSTKIIALSEEVLAAKKDFEGRMKQFQALQEKFEREKEGALEKLREEHQKEIQILEEKCSEHHLLNLEQKYVYEIQRLEEERKSLKVEKDKLAEAFESKLWRAKSLYDTELHATKSLYSNELDALKEHETALREELMARQEEFKDRLEETQLHLQHSKEELAKCEREVMELERRLEEKEMEMEGISKQLDEVKREKEEALNRLHGVENELATTKENYREQEEQLMRKDDLLCALESTKNQLESIIRDMQTELKSLRSKVTFLQNERQNLESQSHTQQQLQNSQLQALEMVLDGLAKEKQMLRDHYEQLMEEQRVNSEQRELRLKKDYTAKLNDFERHHTIFQQELETKAAEHTQVVVKRLETEYDHKNKMLEEENHQLRDQLESVKKQLHSGLPPDVSQIQLKMESAEEKCKATVERLEVEKEQVNALQEEVNTLRDKVKHLNELVKEANEKPPCDFATQHKEEIEKLKETTERSVRESVTKSSYVSRAWYMREEEYQKEIKSLRTELASRTRVVDKLTAAELDKSKATVKTLQDTVDSLRSKLTQYEDSGGKRRASVVSAKSDAENKFLRQELVSTKSELAQCVDLHTRRVNELLRKVKEQRAELNRKNGQDVGSIGSRFPNEDLKNVQKKCKELQEEMEKKEEEHGTQLERITKEHEEKEQQLNELGEQLKSLKEELDATKAELDKKTKEIMHIRSETHEYIRKREQQQSKTHRREVAKLKDAHKNAIKEHETSQDRIRKEMVDLRGKLKQLEDNEQRSSTNEQELETLRQQLQNNENAMKRLEEEKEILQFELESVKEIPSEFSSPMGSMDNLKKRDSICSLGSVREAPNLCKRAVNVAIINKWHSLVEQVQREHKRSKDDTGHKQQHLTQGAIEAAPSGEVAAKSASPDPPSQESQANDNGSSEDTGGPSQTTDRPLRTGRCIHRSANTLKLPDGRRADGSPQPRPRSPRGSPQPKSPSRSPHSKMGSVKRPAWRL